jgi:hypothetical protein
VFRLLEFAGLLAPVGAVVLLVLYRRRARLGAVWGIIGCGVALLGSVAGVLAPRLAGVGALLGASRDRSPGRAW